MFRTRGPSLLLTACPYVFTADAEGPSIFSCAEPATEGPAEQQSCSNFVSALTVHCCGAKDLGAMKAVFSGNMPAKRLTLCAAIENGVSLEGLDRQTTIRLEDRADSQKKHLIGLKGAIRPRRRRQARRGHRPDRHSDGLRRHL